MLISACQVGCTNFWDVRLFRRFRFVRTRSVNQWGALLSSPTEQNPPLLFSCVKSISRKTRLKLTPSPPPAPMNHLVTESAVELVQSGVCLVGVGVPVWVNLGVVDLTVGKQKLRTLVSALCVSGTSPAHGSPCLLSARLCWVGVCWTSANLVSLSTFLTTGHPDSGVCLKGLFVAPGNPSTGSSALQVLQAMTH